MHSINCDIWQPNVAKKSRKNVMSRLKSNAKKYIHSKGGRLNSMQRNKKRRRLREGGGVIRKTKRKMDVMADKRDKKHFRLATQQLEDMRQTMIKQMSYWGTQTTVR